MSLDRSGICFQTQTVNPYVKMLDVSFDSLRHVATDNYHILKFHCLGFHLSGLQARLLVSFIKVLTKMVIVKQPAFIML